MEQLGLAFLMASGIYLIYNVLSQDNRDDSPVHTELSPSEKKEQTLLAKLAGLSGMEKPQLQRALVLAIPGTIVGGIVAWLLWGWLVMVVVGSLIGFLAPIWVFMSRENRKRLTFAEDLAAATDTVRTLLLAGYGIGSALSALTEHGPERLRTEFQGMTEDIALYGLEESLRLAQERLHDPAFDLVALALITADRAGSQVGEVLNKLSQTIRSNLSITRQFQAEQARNVLTARIVAVTPLLILTLLKLTGSNYIEAFDTTVGQFVLLLGLFLIGVGYVAMRLVGRLPQEKRNFK